MELWNNIKTFMTDTAFSLFGFNILWWYVIVAAVAVVFLLIVITVAVVVSKKKKNKNAEKEQKKSDDKTRLVQENKTATQSFNEVSPDWQKNVTKAHKHNSKKHHKNEIVEEPAEPDNAIAEETVEPVSTIVEEEVASTQVEPIEENKQQEAQPIADASPVTEKPIIRYVTVSQQPVVEENNENNLEVAEKVYPVPTKIEVYEPTAQKVKKAPTQVAPAQTKPQQVQPAPAEEIKETTTATYIEEEQALPIYEEQTISQVLEEKNTAPVEAEEEKTTTADNTLPVYEEEVATTTAPPRALPKKKTKTTKKTASQIADDIQEKTGANPRKKPVSDKPAIVGQDKLPKKAKAKKQEPASDNLADAIITTDPNVESFGKFVIIKNDDNSARPFHFRLLANNGQILFESESYKTKPKSNSIIAFKKAAIEENFEIDVDKAGNYRYKLYNSSHAVIGVGESYSTKQGCENSVQSVIKFAESARYLEDQTVDNK